MEKRSFWDRLLGRRGAGQKNPEWVDSNEPPPDGSLREMISGRRVTYEETRRVERVEEERRAEADKRHREAEACLNASSTLEDFLASMSENILESAEKGWDRLHMEISIKDLPSDALKNLKAFKALQTFCSKNKLTFNYSTRSDPKYRAGYGTLPPPPRSYHRIEIVF